MLRQYAVKEYGGLEADLPVTLPYGDTYLTSDTNKFYKYGEDGLPKEISGGGAARDEQQLSVAGQVLSLTNGGSITLPSGGPSWPFLYSASTGSLLQGDNPGTTQVGVTTLGVGAGANLGPTSGGASGDSGNTAIGYYALNLENNEVQSTAVGYKALANQNVAAMFALPSNTAIGYEAGMECTLSLADTFVGADIKNVNPGQSSNNVGVGKSCLQNLQDGFANVALGAYALNGAVSNMSNIAIGYQANNGITTGNNNIVIGHQAQPSSLSVSNEITIGNTSHTAVRLPSGVPEHADNSAAKLAGLVVGFVYRTGDYLKIVH